MKIIPCKAYQSFGFSVLLFWNFLEEKRLAHSPRLLCSQWDMILGAGPHFLPQGREKVKRETRALEQLLNLHVQQCTVARTGYC